MVADHDPDPNTHRVSRSVTSKQTCQRKRFRSGLAKALRVKTI